MEGILGNKELTKERTFKGLTQRHTNLDLLAVPYNALPYTVCQYPLVESLASVYVTLH